MKKIVSLFMSLMIVMLSVIPLVSAKDNGFDKEYFEDGSYITIDLYDAGDVFEEESATSLIARIISAIKLFLSKLFSGNVKTVEKIKKINYFDKNGMLLWSFSLNAEFTYDGKSAVCDSAFANCEIYDGDWKKVSQSCMKSGASARGEVEMQQYKLGVPLKNYKKSVTLTCDKNGNVI